MTHCTALMGSTVEGLIYLYLTPQAVLHATACAEDRSYGVGLLIVSCEVV